MQVHNGNGSSIGHDAATAAANGPATRVNRITNTAVALLEERVHFAEAKVYRSVELTVYVYFHDPDHHAALGAALKVRRTLLARKMLLDKTFEAKREFAVGIGNLGAAQLKESGCPATIVGVDGVRIPEQTHEASDFDPRATKSRTREGAGTDVKEVAEEIPQE